MSTAPEALPIYPGLIGKVAVMTGGASGAEAVVALFAIWGLSQLVFTVRLRLA